MDRTRSPRSRRPPACRSSERPPPRWHRSLHERWMTLVSIDPFDFELPVPSAGNLLEEAVGVEDGTLGKPIEDGAPFAAAGNDARSAQHGEVLAHVRCLTADTPAQIAHRALACSQLLYHAEPFGIRESSGNGCRSAAQRVVGGGDGFHPRMMISRLAQVRK